MVEIRDEINIYLWNVGVNNLNSCKKGFAWLKKKKMKYIQGHYRNANGNEGKYLHGLGKNKQFHSAYNEVRVCFEAFLNHSLPYVRDLEQNQRA